MLDERVDGKVFVRQIDPSDGDPPRVPLYEGDQIIPMMALTHTSLNTSDQPGENDEMIVAMRIVPVRREPGHVFIRSLRHGEVDNGDRVHVRPDDDVSFEPGSMTLELAAIDAQEASQYPNGAFVPITPVLGAWFSIGEHDAEKARYLLAAARRLDAARSLLDRVEELQNDLNESAQSAGRTRRSALDLIRTVEVAMVTVGRVSHMIQKARELVAIETPIPANLTAKHDTIKEIRDAYEHIEERAVGRTFRKVDPSVLEIFDHRELLLNDSIVYRGHILDIKQELPALLLSAREYLITAAGG